MFRLRSLAIADEFVALQGGGDLKATRPDIVPAIRAFRTQDLPDAAQMNFVCPFVIQRDHVFDGPSQIRLSFGREQNSTGADVPGGASECDALNARAND
jgi:hypothetical protein